MDAVRCFYAVLYVGLRGRGVKGLKRRRVEGSSIKGICREEQAPNQHTSSPSNSTTGFFTWIFRREPVILRVCVVEGRAAQETL